MTTAAPVKQGTWHERLYDLTPVELREGRYYKREDLFAPLGEGSINGSKLRQLIWLIHRANPRGIVTGASVLSPQVSMTALVSKHYGLPCVVVLGGTRPETAIRHTNVRIASQAGAQFIFTPVGYNPALQKAVKEAEAEMPGYYRVCYGITTPQDSSDEAVEAFHAVGAHQVKNVPDTVKTMVIAAGSCNSVVSVLYGLAKTPPKSLERIVLVGIGPTRLDFIDDRLAAIERVTGFPLTRYYRRKYHHHPSPGGTGRVTLEHYDLHATKWTTYQQRRPWSQDGITFHPTYEGKMMAYMSERARRFRWLHDADEDALVWIVGAEPQG